ncbi:MAG: ABC transporter substrate-binding protein [Thermodesulfobacteriota bacterium]
MRKDTLVFRSILVAAAWLLLISLLHYGLNVYEGPRQVVTMGYMPVVSNMSAPLLDRASAESGGGVRYKALKFASFAEMAEALRGDEIDVAFIIAPLAVVLRQQGLDVKVIYIGNRQESTLVARKELQVENLADLRGRTVAVPMRYSGHNLTMRQLMALAGLTGQIKIVELNPPDMAAALASGSLDAYFVGEPFAAQTLMNGDANLVFRAEEKCPYFICNLLITRESFIADHGNLVQDLVQGAVRAGLWASQHQDEAAAIAADYWRQSPEIIKYALSTPPNRVDFSKYVPTTAEMQHMAELMVRFGLSQSADIGGLVDDSFSRKANTAAIHDFADILASDN